VRILLLLALAAATPAWGQQKAHPVEGMTQAQRADYRKLMRGYVDTFRVLGRFKVCRLEFDVEPFFREVAARHGEGSEAMKVARLGYAATTENLVLSQDVDPTPPAPIPCDVMVHMRGMQLPAVPASLLQ